MERRTAEKEKTGIFKEEFFTPVKGYQEGSHQMSTTGNFNSNEAFSFDKMVQRQKMAVKYCSANLNELLSSDIKFKSPAHLVKVNTSTPARNDWDGSAFFEIVQEYDSAAKFMANKLNLDMTIRKDPHHSLKIHEELGRESGYYNQPNFEFAYPYRQEFNVEEGTTRQNFHYKPQGCLYPLSDVCNSNDDFRKRKRKNNIQLKILKNEFSKGDCWNKEKITHVAQVTGLSESQVYKWCWDQKKKIEEQENHYRQDSGKMKIEHQLRAALMDFDDDDDLSLPSELGKVSDNINKRRPERQPFGFMSKNRL